MSGIKRDLSKEISKICISLGAGTSMPLAVFSDLHSVSKEDVKDLLSFAQGNQISIEETPSFFYGNCSSAHSMKSECFSILGVLFLAASTDKENHQYQQQQATALNLFAHIVERAVFHDPKKSSWNMRQCA